VDAALILHETRTRLRLRAPAAGADATLADALRRVPGVLSVRTNGRLACVIVQHDGAPRTRATVLRACRDTARRSAGPGPARGESREPHCDPGRPPTAGVALGWATAVAAAAVPALPRGLRAGAALGVVGVRAATRLARTSPDAAAVLLDSVSLGALAVTGQAPTVSASVLLRLLAEGLSERLVRQADGLLREVLPQAAVAYPVRRPDADRTVRTLCGRIRPGDRLRLADGDVVPVDGCVTAGSAVLHSVMVTGATRSVDVGAHVRAGERLVDGRFEMQAESDAAGSRLERLRAQVAHAIASHDPVGRLTPDLERWLSLPLSGAAVVFGLTGDGARAAAMLQADPMRGLDLAMPVAREAAQYVLARHGLLAAGLASAERLADARTLLLQDTGVMAVGRWTLAALRIRSGGDPSRVRAWLARLAGIPSEALETGGIADATVRAWTRHGALLRIDGAEIHLAAGDRLERVWGLPMPPPATDGADGSLRRTFAVVADGRVEASVALASAWRAGIEPRLARLRRLGFDRIAVCVERDGDASTASAARSSWHRMAGVDALDEASPAVREWLDASGAGDAPAVIVHTVLRDLVPPGSLSLAPANADAGAHGVLLGDPLASLEAARRLALRLRRRLRNRQALAVAGNAALMTAAALRWLPPIATTLLHHGFAVGVLLDSLLIERLTLPAARPASSPDPGSPSTESNEGDRA
jgi:cation transport ATPase